MKFTYIQLQLLALGLMERGTTFIVQEHMNGGIITVNDENGEYLWDAICHDGSYGHEEGLLEIMGILVDESSVGDTVEGWLTAEEVLKRWDEKRA